MNPHGYAVRGATHGSAVALLANEAIGSANAQLQRHHGIRGVTRPALDGFMTVF